jgi:hypothetical protein
VTVNARGVVMDVRFAADATELSLDEIASALVAAAQDAADEVVRRGVALMMAAIPGAEALLSDAGELAKHAGVPTTLTLGGAADENGCGSEWDYGSEENSLDIWAQGQPGGRIR